MAVPLIGRWLAAVVGGLLVLTVWGSVIGTLIVPRPVGSWLTRWVDRLVNGAFSLVTAAIAEYPRRDRVLARQAPAILFVQLAAWLGVSLLGYWLLMWPLVSGGLGAAFTAAGSSLFTLGFAEPAGAAPAAIVFVAAATGLVIVALQIAYLPTLYAAFNRRETEVTLLNARAGVPSWGPELLARTHYALGSGNSTLDTLADLYAQWERWAADVTESHTTYLPLVRFRSPRPLFVLGGCAAGGAGLRSSVPGAVPRGRAGGPGSAVPAKRLHVLQPGRPGDGLCGAGGSRPGRPDQPQL
jgi:hypothetical protein